MELSLIHIYRGAVEKKYKVLPAWGVTDYSDISNVTVDDQKIDEAVSYTHLDVYKRQVDKYNTETEAIEDFIERLRADKVLCEL